MAAWTVIIQVIHIETITVITSLAKELMFLVALVCLFACLSVDKIAERIGANCE